MDFGSTHLHVVPSLDRGWVVRETADGPALRRTTTRRGALEHATLSLSRRGGGVVDVHAVDGTVLETHEVASLGKRPWWYQRPRPLSGVVAVYLAVEGVLFLSGPTSVPRVLAVLVLVLAAFSIASLVLSWRSDRRQGPLRRRLRPPVPPHDD